MAISFDKAFGIHQYTIGARAQRAEVLSNNIANADTPGYKAQDLDFSAALQQAQGVQAAAAQLIGISERSFWYRLKKLDIHVDKIIR